MKDQTVCYHVNAFIRSVTQSLWVAMLKGMSATFSKLNAGPCEVLAYCYTTIRGQTGRIWTVARLDSRQRRAFT